MMADDLSPENEMRLMANQGDEDGLLSCLQDSNVGIDTLDSSTNRYSALHHAADAGHIGIVRILLAHGANPNVRSGEFIKDGEFFKDWYWESGDTPLMLSARKGHSEVVRLLIEMGAQVQLEDATSSTALHAACAGDHGEIVDDLLSEGAKTEVSCGHRHFDEELGWHFMLTPLHVAANCGSVEAARRLLKCCSPDSECFITRRTPLMYSAARGYADLIKLLCQHGANPNHREHRHEYAYFLDSTPLHYAATNGHVDAVKMLLNSGAEPRAIESHGGQTAQQVAESEGHDEVAVVLKQAKK